MMIIGLLLVAVNCADIAVWDAPKPFIYWHGISIPVRPEPSPDDRCYICVSDNAIIRVLMPKEAGS